MLIQDIDVGDVKLGKVWRVVDDEEDQLMDSFPLGLNVEPLGEYSPEDTVVYSGMAIYIRGESEPKDEESRHLCAYAPDDPSALREGQVPVLYPLLMVKVVGDCGWDCLEFRDGCWRRVGEVPNPLAPVTEEFFNAVLADDYHFSIKVDGTTIGGQNVAGFRSWSSYL